MRLELISVSWKDYVIIFNLHNVSQVPLYKLTDKEDPRFKENAANHSEDFPQKNYNEFNVFAVKNTKEKGTETIEKLDKYEM